MRKLLLFLISTDDSMCGSLERKVEKEMGHNLRIFSASAAMFSDSRIPDIILFDARPSEHTLQDLLKDLRYHNVAAPVITILDRGNTKAIENAVQNGSRDFIEVPIDDLRLGSILRNIFDIVALRDEVGRLQDEMRENLLSLPVVAESREMKLVLRMIEQIQGKDFPVLITGEAGTGREFVARTIHAQSRRRDQPFMAISPASVAEDMLTGTLFGFEKGAVPGIEKRTAGLFQQADGGTVYVSELTGLGMDLQERLMHLLRHREVRPVGARKSETVDVRLMISMIENPRELLEKKQINRELYFRLLSLPIHLPPLRERGTDIILLAETFLERIGEEENSSVKGFTREALEAIYRYPWPGNVRELEHAIRHAHQEAKGKHDRPRTSSHNAVRPLQGLLSMELETEGRLFPRQQDRPARSGQGAGRAPGGRDCALGTWRMPRGSWGSAVRHCIK
jgi:DNA-binding NtrC family response regulator